MVHLATSFDDATIPYMIIGGQAVLHHGSARFTKDVDLTLGIAPTAPDQILELAERVGRRLELLLSH